MAWNLGPPARATSASNRSPTLLSANTPGAFTSPKTLTTLECLWLDRAISQPCHDSLLNVGNCSRGRGNLSSVRDVDATLLIDGLRRQIDEVARACSRGSSWCEQS